MPNAAVSANRQPALRNTARCCQSGTITNGNSTARAKAQRQNDKAKGWISPEVARATKALPAHSRLDNNRPAAAQAEREFITWSQRLSATGQPIKCGAYAPNGARHLTKRTEV